MHVHHHFEHLLGILIALPAAAVVFRASWRSYTHRPRRRSVNRK
jgi:hypothetical protein